MFRYTGTKKNEIKYFVQYLPKTIKIIVEPFGGSGAVSYWMHGKYGTRFHLNDLSAITYGWYQYISSDKWANFLASCVDYLKSFAVPITSADGIIIGKKMKADNTPISIYCHHLIAFMPKSDNIRVSKYERCVKQLIDESTDKSKHPTINLSAGCIFSQLDFKIILDQYKDSDAFIFIDPPYLSNRDKIGDCYFTDSFSDEHFLTLRDFIRTAKCQVMIIVLDSVFMQLCFEGFIKHAYNKTYSATYKKVKHLVITNYHNCGDESI